MPSTEPSASTGLSRRSFLGVAGFTIGGAALTALAGCSSAASPSGSGSGSKSGRYRIVQPSSTPLVVWSVTYLAEDEGYYKAEGLDVSRVFLSGGPAALTGLLSGAGEILNSTPGETLAASVKGQDLKVLMGHTNNMPSTFVLAKSVADQLGVTATSPLAARRTALARIKHGRYGITAPGSQTDGFTRLALRQVGLDPDKDAQLIPLQTATNCIAALSKNRIDGFLAVPPAGETAAVEFGAAPILTAQDGDITGADTVQGMCTVARGTQVSADSALYAAAIRAEVKAMKQLNDDPQGSGRLLRKSRFSSLSDEVWTATWSKMGPSLKSPVVTAQSLRGWIANGLVSGVDPSASTGFPYGRVLDAGYLDTALRHAGWQPA